MSKVDFNSVNKLNKVVDTLSRLDPKRSTHGNRRVSLSESQFLETHSKASKASGILARLKNGNPPDLSCTLNLRKYSNTWNSIEISQNSI